MLLMVKIIAHSEGLSFTQLDLDGLLTMLENRRCEIPVLLSHYLNAG